MRAPAKIAAAAQRREADQARQAPPTYPEAKSEAIDPALRDQARTEIDSGLHAERATIRTHAVETARDALGIGARQEVLLALKDRTWQVRFAAAIAAGELRLPEAHDELTRLVEGAEDNRNARIAEIFALHRLGVTRFSHDLEQTARDNDPLIRANTVMVLGMLGRRAR
jgi:HEAT repeat protein